MQKLRPKMSYSHTEKDMAFVQELSKVGYVHILSSQVILRSDKGKGFSFKEYGGEQDCAGLTLPENWKVEGIYHDEQTQITSITFGTK